MEVGMVSSIWIYLLSIAPQVLGAIVILIVGIWLSKRIANICEKLLKKREVDITLSRFLRGLIYYALVILVLIAAAGQLGINTMSFLTVLGALGLAVGLALKDSLSNIAAGVMLLIFRPFRVGDAVTVAGVTGGVQLIGLFNTILHTPDNQKIIVPNAKILGDIITNITANDTRRIDLVVGISYEDDIDKAKALLWEMAAKDPRILKDPATTVAVAELADSSVNLVFRPWVKTSDYWAVRFDLIEQIKKTFDQEGISIPYPQQDVHLFVEKSPKTPQ
ncbi:MscS Mechanosensitive ion channel [Thermodesulfatator indicus DSM 15286]|uniref:MscS Mechanosensitive ion channel n=1 Tax=Thermodesulfatator indicus (strain DSM 15286 / JCM 11887 / CIR29812) TaxID=667014 RepID=F8A882_THEID|nr:mechanosensitive ion channel domain-containing protein [Thermodesulfatator indicus]AEH44480.1 MscS Mechanosensitive ion channel [Thermodesulfatator indicus DSM 15286]